MIKLIGIKELKVYDESTKLVTHTLDTRITFDDVNNIAQQVYNELKKQFNYNIDPEPLYVTGGDTYFSFKVVIQNADNSTDSNKSDNIAVNK